MSKAPTVSEMLGKDTDITFKSNISPTAAIDDIRPDFDTDVLWKPQKLSRKPRTMSMDSTDSEITRKLSINESIGSASGPTSPVDVQPRSRRMSFTEMLFGSPSGGFSWGQSGLQQQQTNEQPERKGSVTEDARFKELMKHQNRILGDDGISGGFKMRDYVKK
ncbi:hypothetical protein WR25_01673 [Diploscapter pachys]|uniref:Uncharacterized protein n=1 Tax=Diploscapter pachys TaxID=2018661 RepID=A0A2A2JSE2_9BILA|nr:hypothetical protein WR25_01673 [Diploscapter pachys]